MATASPSSTHFMIRFHYDDAGKLILRLAIGGLMLVHGIDKVLHGVSGMVDMIASKGLPGALAYGAYVGELIAPILILIGLFTRIAGLLVTFTMITAIGLVHMGDLMKLTPHGGYALELQVLYLLGGLAIFFLGAGKFSITRGHGPWN